MMDKNDINRFAYIYVLVASGIIVVTSLTDPAHSFSRKLFDVALSISLVTVSAWQLLKMRKR